MQSLSAIYKYFVRPYLDYSDATFDQSYKASFHRKRETSQYNKALAITEAIIGTAKGKIFDEVILYHYKVDTVTENYLVCTKLLLASLLVMYST